MNTRHLVAVGLAAGLLLGGPAKFSRAQWGGYGGYGYYPHSSTAAEGYQRGLADVVRSAGVANLLNSQAANFYEDARAKDYDNRLKGTETYFTLRRMNQQYRDAERGTPATAEQLFRWAHRDSPRTLNSYEFDPLTGQINWPLVLRVPPYDDYRKSTEQFFRMRAIDPQNLDEYSLLRLQEVVENWLYDLKGDIKEFKANDYLRARKFIESLSAEASKS